MLVGAPRPIVDRRASAQAPDRRYDNDALYFVGGDEVNANTTAINSRVIAVGILLALPLASCHAQAWIDPSPHAVRFVEVEAGVRLEVLDWGGQGSPILLLAGHGDTGHIFD